MVVPFQMVMFTLSRTAEQVKLPYFSFTSMAFAKIGLNTPWTIPIVYLGFGAGLAVFMFSGFVKTIPLEIEEAAAIDGCGPVRTFFLVVLPMLKPTFISVGVLEIMWVWNDFLLPYLVLDLNKYRTIPIVIQYLKGSYGQVDMGATMALILLSIVPVIIFYLCCQKHIIKGVAAGAVKRAKLTTRRGRADRPPPYILAGTVRLKVKSYPREKLSYETKQRYFNGGILPCPPLWHRYPGQGGL